MNYQEAYKKLEKYGQLHVLKYYEELSGEEKEELLSQIEQTDFEVLSLCKKKETLNPRGKIEPLEVMQLPEIEEKKSEYGHEAWFGCAEGCVQHRSDKGRFYFPAADRKFDGCGEPSRCMGSALCDDQ